MLDLEWLVIDDTYPYLHKPGDLDCDGEGNTVCGMTFIHCSERPNAKFVWPYPWQRKGYEYCLECSHPHLTWHTCKDCGRKTLDGNCPDHPAIMGKEVKK